MPDGVIDDAEPVPAERRNLVYSALDRAMHVHGAMVEKNIARARQRRPDATPAEVVRSLERMYRSALTGTGATVGAVAAVPAVGTGTALALSGGEVLTTLELTALFAFSLAEIHGVPLDEVERRRTLVMGIMIGGSARVAAPIGSRTTMWRASWGMDAGRLPDGGVFVAVDVHYLPAGGARAAAIVAADVTFGDLLADRTAPVPQVRPYRPGGFYLRELPPLPVVLDGLAHMRLLVVDGYADLDPAGRPARPRRPRRVRRPGHLAGQCWRSPRR